MIYIDGHVEDCLLRFKTDLSTLRCGSNIGDYINQSNITINFPWKAPYITGGITTFPCMCYGTLESNDDPITQTITGPSGTVYRSNYFIKGYIESVDIGGTIGNSVGIFIAYRIE